MTDYENSSHLSSWMFTTEELLNARTRANHDAIRFLEERRIASETPDGNVATPPPQQLLLPPQSFAKLANHKRLATDNDTAAPRIAPPEPLPESTPISTYLTPTEEHALLQFYATKLPTLIGPNAQVKNCAKPSKVVSTAALFLKRFYLSNSVMMYDPKCVMVASAFLASKVEDQMFHIKYLEDGTKSLQSHVSLMSIINSEIALINGIDFDLLCFHPYSTIQAYTDDLRSFKSKNPNGDGTFRRYVSILDLHDPTDPTTTDPTPSPREDPPPSPTAGSPRRRHKVDARDLLAPVYALARTLVETVSYVSCGDVGLTATPGQIGLAALYVANRRLMRKAGERARAAVEGGGERGEDVVEIDFEGYIRNRFPDRGENGRVWERVKEIGAVLEEEEKWVQDMVLLKGINKKLKGCRAWGGEVGGKKKKKKKVKKRKRVEEGEGVVT